jgi:hypothetical protein
MAESSRHVFIILLVLPAQLLLSAPLLFPHAHLPSSACSHPLQYGKNTTLAFARSFPRFRLLDPFQVTRNLPAPLITWPEGHES